MCWKKKIAELEKANDWKAAIQFVELVNVNDPEPYLRVLFLLLDFLVDGQYTQEEHNCAATKLRDIFDSSHSKFSENPEFLFFCGLMSYIAEWYFGMESIEQANEVLEKAMNLEPRNILYKWGYISRTNQCIEENAALKLQLSKRLLFSEASTLIWLKSKGLLGRYVFGTLEGTYEDLINLNH